MKSPFCRFVFLMLLASWTAQAQDSLRVGGSGISLSAFVDKTEVPYNRLLVFTVHLEWSGELDRYEIHPFDNPIVQNFEIVGNASSNRVAVVAGEPTAVQEYTFTLKPESMGMGYIEGMILKKIPMK